MSIFRKTCLILEKNSIHYMAFNIYVRHNKYDIEIIGLFMIFHRSTNLNHLINLFFILTFSVFAQPDIKRFENFLPNNIKKSFTKLKAISIELDEKSKIHPDLIFYYLESLIFSDKTYYAEIEEYYTLKKNHWLNDIISQIKETTVNVTLKNQAISILIEHRNDIEIDTNYISKVNINKKNIRDYNVLKYYNKHFNEDYKENVDYKILRDENEIERKKHIDRIIQEADNLEYISKITDNWSLFSESDQDINKIPKIIINIIKKNNAGMTEYDIREESKFGINLGYMYGINTLEINKHFFSSDHLTFNLNSKLISQSIFIGLNYLIPINNRSAFISYLDFELNYVKLFIPDENINKRLRYVQTNSGENLDYDADINISSAYSIILNLRIPILSFDNFVYFELGSAFKKDEIKYIIDYKYDYRKYIPFNPTAETAYKEEILEEHKSEVKFIPYANLVFRFLPNMNINLNGTYKFISIYTNYYF